MHFPYFPYIGSLRVHDKYGQSEQTNHNLAYCTFKYPRDTPIHSTYMKQLIMHLITSTFSQQLAQFDDSTNL